MTAFIKQEAMEKAREIEIKANEEFEIEKSKLVRQETDAIDSQYEKKFKQATMSQQITRSTVANKTRLKVLGARQELLDSIFEEAQKQLADGAKDKAKYQKILKGLLLEGFYALNEPKLLVQARKKDNEVVKKAIEEAAKEYKKQMGKDVEAKIDDANPLPEGSYVFSNLQILSLPLTPPPPFFCIHKIGGFFFFLFPLSHPLSLFLFLRFQSPLAPSPHSHMTNIPFSLTANVHRAGGVVIVSGNGKIDINNTFETRLELLKDSSAPAVREALFGKNPNRKFFD